MSWDIAFILAVHGVPRGVIRRLRSSSLLRNNIWSFVRLTQKLHELARKKAELGSRLRGRPDLFRQHVPNSNREETAVEPVIQPNFDNSPFRRPLGSANA